MARTPAPPRRPAAPAAPAPQAAAPVTRTLVVYDPDSGEVAGTHTVEWLDGATPPPENEADDLAEAAAVLEIETPRRAKLRLLRPAAPIAGGAQLKVERAGNAVRLVATPIQRPVRPARPARPPR